MPEPGTLWVHYKGGIYRVVTIGKLEATEEPAIVYQRFAAPGMNDIWIRTAADWFADVPGHGPRFRPAT